MKTVLKSAALTSVIMTFAIGQVAIAAGTPRLNIGQVVVTTAQHSPASPFEISAFVPTLSSEPCQLTLAESNFAVPGTTAFCGVREMDGIYGAFIHIFLPEAAPADSLWVVNIYQDRARGYGDPVAYTGD